jgi:hypothetical protein
MKKSDIIIIIIILLLLLFKFIIINIILNYTRSCLNTSRSLYR